MVEDPHPTEHRRLTTSDRDLDTLAVSLTRWLADRVTADQPPEITHLSRPDEGGMSNSSVMFDARWVSRGEQQEGAFVLRMAPEDESLPLFQTYDLERQYQIMRTVATTTDLPLPTLRWSESDPGPIGAPFLVMDRVDGRVPVDNPPYVFTGWLFDATPAERAVLQQATLEIIGKLHAIPEPAHYFAMLDGPGDSLRKHVEHQRTWYRWALADDGYHVPVIERGFDWLEDNWPTKSGPDVLCWGDARPGNIIFRGFRPVAVLDWEMATLGPREFDVAWLIFMHRFFQDIARSFDQPGLPDFLRRIDVVREYQERTGQHLTDLDFHLVYAAVRHAIVMARIKRRMVHFGEDTDTANPDDYVMHRAMLEAMLEGTYEWN